MTNPEKRVYGLMRRAVWILHGGKCYLSGQELADPVTHDGGHPWEVHHIKHQGTFPHMRFDLDNVVPLALTVHKLDDKGELAVLICNKMGMPAWVKLNRRANVITRPYLDAIESNFNQIIRRGHGSR